MYLLINGYLHRTTERGTGQTSSRHPINANCIEARWDKIPLFKVMPQYMRIIINMMSFIRVAWWKSIKQTLFKTRVQKQFPIYDQIKWPKLISYVWSKRMKNHTLWGGTYLCSPFKGGLTLPHTGTRHSSCSSRTLGPFCRYRIALYFGHLRLVFI